MRLKVSDRIICAISGLILFVLGVFVGLWGFGFVPQSLVDYLPSAQSIVLWQRAVVVAVAVLVCVIAIYDVTILFRSHKDKGFIMQHTEYGDLSISMSAMENMVKKCIDSHNELKVTHTRILHGKDSVIIDLRIALANGVNIPITVNSLQKQIKQYITSCSGVDVKEVRVTVETNNSLASVQQESIPTIHTVTEEAPLHQEAAAPTFDEIATEEPVIIEAAESEQQPSEDDAPAEEAAASDDAAEVTVSADEEDNAKQEEA